MLNILISFCTTFFLTGANKAFGGSQMYLSEAIWLFVAIWAIGVLEDISVGLTRIYSRMK